MLSTECDELKSISGLAPREGEAVLPAAPGGDGGASWAAGEGVHDGGQAQDGDQAVQLAHRDLRRGGAR